MSKIIKISSIANVVSGQSPESVYYSKCYGTPFLQGSSTFGDKYPKIEQYTTKVTKIASQGSVLMSVRAPVGDLNIAPCDICIGRGLASLSAKNSSNEFLYYCLKNSINQLIVRSSGTTYSAVDKKTIDDFDVVVPNNENEWEKTIEILSSLDRKIALNRKINAELEQMAKELYDYWFVQFDFPNAEGKPYKSSGGKMVYNPQLKRDIPEGWEVGNIFSVSELITGGTPSKKISEYWENGTIPFFGPTDFDGSLYQIGTKDKITHLGLEHSAANLIAPNCIIITARGSIGKVVVTGVEMAMNQSCFAFSPINDTYPFLYFLTKQLIQHLLVKGSGSTFNSIVTVDIENSIMSLGNAHFRQLFSNKIKPFFNKLRLNTDEIQQLSSLRDQLLPLLMNGQVKIHD